MDPQNLYVHSADPAATARIAEALQAGLPGSSVHIAGSANEFTATLARDPAAGFVSAAGKPPENLCAELRHELNNHLALIRMLADFLAEDRQATPFCTAKAREIGNACEAAAAVLRRAKTLEG